MGKSLAINSGFINHRSVWQQNGQSPTALELATWPIFVNWKGLRWNGSSQSKIQAGPLDISSNLYLEMERKSQHLLRTLWAFWRSPSAVSVDAKIRTLTNPWISRVIFIWECRSRDQRDCLLSFWSEASLLYMFDSYVYVCLLVLVCFGGCRATKSTVTPILPKKHRSMFSSRDGATVSDGAKLWDGGSSPRNLSNSGVAFQVDGFFNVLSQILFFFKNALVLL